MCLFERSVSLHIYRAFCLREGISNGKGTLLFELLFLQRGFSAIIILCYFFIS